MFGYYLDLAIRSLKHNKVLTALMVLAIGVGIGASMTTLTVMHLLSGDPLPGKSASLFRPLVDPDPTPSRKHDTPMDVMDYRSAVDLWNAHRADRQTLVVDSPVKLAAPASKMPPLMPSLLATTADFFAMFDVPFQYGSGWSDADDQRRSRVAVISASLNDKLFGGANSVGQILHLRSTDVRIIGVLKPWRPSPLFYLVAGGRFAHGDTAGFYGKPEDVFVPFSSSLEINDGYFYQFTCWAAPKVPGHLIDAPCEWVSVWVELGDAGKVAAYRRFVADYAAQQKALARYTNADNTRLPSLMEWLDYNGVVPGDVHLQAWLAFAFLAICLCNTIGLLLAKFLRRGSEIGVRRALGATHAAIFMQFLIEAGLVGLLGGILGWLLTLAGLSLVRQQPTPYADMVHLDEWMFLTTFVLSLAVSLLAGTLPAFRASRIAPALQLKAQ
ncbi:ABC transporter permease [Dyella choica]|uniref:FtsX-like permease family protein n=1 Tax=Dyella choica TaxID=1927959 RepID=A0A3S0RI96_9GAMM|nr:ABC transporter permease [Dyella choica]RUL71427.1 FtsX-like permease family protein [Dyella choica]